VWDYCQNQSERAILAIVTSPIAAPFVKELVGIVTKRHGLDHLVRESQLRGTRCTEKVFNSTDHKIQP